MEDDLRMMEPVLWSVPVGIAPLPELCEYAGTDLSSVTRPVQFCISVGPRFCTSGTPKLVIRCLRREAGGAGKVDGSIPDAVVCVEPALCELENRNAGIG